MRQQLRDLGFFVIALTVVLGWYYYPFLSEQLCFYRHDLTAGYEPFCHYIASAFRQGRFPLWNSLSFCGMPQVAVTSPSIFYPAHLLLPFFSFSRWLAIVLLCHQLIAATGAYLLVGSLGWGTAPAILAGITLACCGYMFSLDTNYTLITTAAWLPMSLWCARRVGSSFHFDNFWAIAGTATSILLMLTAGRPEIWIPGLLILAAFIVISGASSPNPERLTQAGLRVLALVLGILLSMPFILPALEWTSLSPRAHGLSPEAVFKWSANWYDFLCLMCLPPLGDLTAYRPPFLSLISKEPFSYVPSAFVGPIAITLAIWSAFDKSYKERFWLIAGLAICAVLSLGENTPISPFIVSKVPALSLFRYPVKFLIFCDAILAVMAARGLHIILQRRQSIAGQIFTWSLWGTVCGAGLLMIACGGSLLHIMQPATVIDSRLLEQAGTFIGRSALIAASVGLLVCLLVRLGYNGAIDMSLVKSTLVAGTAVCLLAAAGSNSRQGAEGDYFERNSNLRRDIGQLFPEGSVSHRFLPLIFDPVTRPLHYQGSQGLDRTAWFTQYQRQLLVPNTHLETGVSLSIGYDLVVTADYEALIVGVESVFRSRLAAVDRLSSGAAMDMPALVRFCRLTASKYIETPLLTATSSGLKTLPLLDPKYFELMHEYPNMNVRVYELRDCPERAHFARSWKPVVSRSDFARYLMSTGDEGLDPAHEVQVEVPSSGSPIDSLPHKWPEENHNQASTRTISDRQENVSFQLNTECPRLFILSDTFYPGWRALLDGQPTPIYQTNIIQRSVVVPAGKHIVEFKYMPISLIRGLLLCLLAVLILIVLAVRAAVVARWSLPNSTERQQQASP